MAKKIAKAPVEWVDGKIVLGAPPANPLKGKGNQRLTKEEVGWAITESLFDWFYKNLEDRHKTSGRKFHDPDDLGDMLREDPNFNNNYHAISPEAKALLKDKLEFWEERAKENKKLKREQKKQEMEGGDFETPPEWVGEKIVLLKPAESPNKKYYWKPNFDGENYKAVLWFRDHLPNTHQGQITDPNNGYPAKTMSTEAGELWFKHKGFWLAQYYIPIKEKEAQKKELVSVGQETLKTASAKAGVSLKELNQKLERLSTLAKGEDLDLAIRMVSDFDDVWLFESLLAGSTIDKDGYLVPGKPLKMFKAHAEFFGILALVNAPESTNLHASLNKIKLQYFKINDPVLEMLDLYGKHIVKKCPTLRGTGNLNFGGLKSLSAGTAEALSMHIGGLSLNELTSLSDDAAKPLGMHYGYLSLNGLTNLSNAGAESLSRHDGGLYLDGLKTLNNATAEALSKHEGELHLGGLKNLSDAAAKALGKHKGELSLGGLASLGDSPGHIALAEKFASQKGELGLSSLKSLSDGAAEALSKYDGELGLGGLKSLSDGAAEALSKHKGDLDCSYLESLSDSPGHVALAKKLASQKGELNLWRLKSLGDAAAKALSMYKKDLRIDDLVSLNDSPGHIALAGKLASQKRELDLGGLKNLSVAAAEALSKHKGELSLWGLKSLSDTVAKSLSKHKGPLNLQGLESLSSAVAEALSKHEGDLDLMHLNSLSDFPGHVALAGKLARQKGDLRLYYLKSLSDSAAEALSKREGKLDLHGLKSLSDAAAEALSKLEGDLNLDGLKSLSDAGAQALAKKKGGKHKMSLPSEIQKQVDKYKKK